MLERMCVCVRGEYFIFRFRTSFAFLIGSQVLVLGGDDRAAETGDRKSVGGWQTHSCVTEGFVVRHLGSFGDHNWRVWRRELCV